MSDRFNPAGHVQVRWPMPFMEYGISRLRSAPLKNADSDRFIIILFRHICSITRDYRDRKKKKKNADITRAVIGSKRYSHTWKGEKILQSLYIDSRWRESALTRQTLLSEIVYEENKCPAIKDRCALQPTCNDLPRQVRRASIARATFITAPSDVRFNGEKIRNSSRSEMTKCALRADKVYG